MEAEKKKKKEKLFLVSSDFLGPVCCCAWISNLSKTVFLVRSSFSTSVLISRHTACGAASLVPGGARCPNGFDRHTGQSPVLDEHGRLQSALGFRRNFCSRLAQPNNATHHMARSAGENPT